MAEAVDEALPLAEAAARAGAQIVFLPEYCGGLVSDGTKFCPPAEPEASHPFLDAIRSFAQSNKVWVNVGSVAIARPDGKIVNRGFMISDEGEITGRYDKIHLFDVDLGQGLEYRESDTVKAGSKAVVHETPHASIGHAICYDLRFPSLFHDLTLGGADILACPAAFTKVTGEAHWHVLNRARAIENTRFVVSACAVGPVPGGGECYGHSLVVGPWGDVLADGVALPGVVHAQLDLDQIDIAQSKIPSIKNVRSYSMDVQQSQRSVA